MSIKALFLDRDDTILKDPGYNISTIEIISECIPVLLAAQEKNYMLVVISNQSGIGRGYFSSEDVIRFHERMSQDFLRRGVAINHFYFCPHKPEDHCACRKPQTGLIDQAAKELDIDLTHSLMIGDRDTDRKLAEKLHLPYFHTPESGWKRLMQFLQVGQI